MVEAEAADLAGAVLHCYYQVLVALELRDEIDRRVLPPIDLALRQRRRGGGRILHEVPHDTIDIDHFGTGAEARLPVRARHVIGVLFEYDALAGYALGRHEFKRPGADGLLDLLESVGVGQTLRHDRAIRLRQRI